MIHYGDQAKGGMRVKTGIVITGGPSAGKSTVVEAIAKQGHRVIREIGSGIMREGKAQFGICQKIWSSGG